MKKFITSIVLSVIGFGSIIAGIIIKKKAN